MSVCLFLGFNFILLKKKAGTVGKTFEELNVHVYIKYDDQKPALMLTWLSLLQQVPKHNNNPTFIVSVFVRFNVCLALRIFNIESMSCVCIAVLKGTLSANAALVL